MQNFKKNFLLFLLFSVCEFALAQSLSRAHIDFYVPPGLDDYWQYETRYLNESTVDEDVDATISSIKDLLSRNKNPSQKPQLLIRIAELYEKKALLERQAEIESFKSGLEKFTTHLEKLKTPPAAEKSKIYLQKSYESYQELLASFSQFTNDVKVNFAVGRILLLQKDANGLMYFDHLATLKGGKKEKNLAMLWSAIYYFELKRYSGAKKIFDNLLRAQPRATQNYAKYQSIWADFFAKKESPTKITTALRIHLDSVKNSKGQVQKKNKQKSADEVLTDYILNDLTFLLASQFKDVSSKSLLAEYHRDDLRLSLLEYEIKALLAKGLVDRVLATIKKISSEFPTYRNLYLVQVLEKDIYFAKGAFGNMLSTIAQMNIYFNEKSAWNIENQKKFTAAFTQKVQNYLRSELMSIPGKLQKTRLSEQMRSLTSIQIYEFLRKNDKGSSSSMRFMVDYAETLRSARRLSDSTEVLTQIVSNKSFKIADKKKISLTMIEQAQVIYAPYRNKKVSNANKNVKPPKDIYVYNSAVEAFIAINPKDPRAPSLAMTRAMNKLNYGDPNAVSEFRSIVKSYSPSPEADASMKLILAKQKSTGSWSNVESDSTSYLKANKFYSPKTRDIIFEDLKTSQLRIGEMFVKQGKSGDAAIKFERFADNFPSDYRTPGILVSTFYLRVKLAKSSDIVKVALKYLKNYPGDKNRPELVRTYADMLLRVGDVKASAFWFTQFAKENPRHKNAMQLMSQGLSLYRAVDDVDLALKAIEEFTLLNPNASRSPEIQFHKAEMLEEIGQLPQAIKVYENLSKPSIALNDRTALAAVKAEVVSMRLNKELPNSKRIQNLQKVVASLPYDKYPDSKNELAKLFLSLGIAVRSQMRFVEKGDPADFIRYSESLEKQGNMLENSLMKPLVIGAKKIEVETYYHLVALHRELAKKYQGLLNKNDFIDRGSFQRANAKREKMFLEHQIKANKYLESGIQIAQNNMIMDGMYYKLLRENQKSEARSGARVDEVHYWPSYLSLKTSASFKE